MSSNEVAVSVRGLSKSYSIAHESEQHVTATEALLHRIGHPFKRTPKETFWALQDINIEIEQGDVVGIIGRNGAGKSTLLKILSRITEPTKGQIDLYGRVGALLEVGTGFSAELTGRENVFLNGAILGMSKREITRQFDEIVEFSGTSHFLDTPVKRYSSGMYVRLAFAVAAHLNPEILIVDEVLAVGDAEFQKRCIGKMKDVSKNEGRTVLFVSHNMTAVDGLCNNAIWMDQGRLRQEGRTQEVVKAYLSGGASSTDTDRLWMIQETAPGTETVKIRRITVRPEIGDPCDPITVRTPILLEFEYWNLEEDAALGLSVHVFGQNEACVFASGAVGESKWNGKPFPKGLFRSTCWIPGDFMNNGEYRVQLLVVKDQGTLLFNMENAVTFEIHDSADFRGAWHGEWPGAVRPILDWQTELLETP